MSPQATGAHVGTADPPRGGAGGDAYLHETEIAGNVAGYLFRGDGRSAFIPVSL